MNLKVKRRVEITEKELMMESQELKPNHYLFTEKWFYKVSLTWGIIILIAGLLYIGILQGVITVVLFGLMSFVGYWLLKNILGLTKLNQKLITQKIFSILLGFFWYIAVFATTNCILVTIYSLSMGQYEASYFTFACAFVPLGLALAVSHQWELKADFKI